MEKEQLQKLVERARTGEEKALNELFAETYNDVYYFALKTVKNEDLAADITQETYIVILQNIGSLKEAAAYSAWSRQITYRQCLRHLKDQNLEGQPDENEDGHSQLDDIREERTDFIPDEAMDREDFRKEIMGMVDRLPREQRTALLLYYYDELSVPQIAQIQGVSEGTVKSRLNYGRKAVKASVEEYEKKNGIKLRSVAVLPLLLWLFRTQAGETSMAADAAASVASGVSAATGATLSAGAGAGKIAATGLALWQKIVFVAGLSAVVVSGGVLIANRPAESAPPGTTVAVTTQVTKKVWFGKGKLNVGLNLSSENVYTLTLSSFDSQQLKGSLLLQVPNGTVYSTQITGVAQSENNYLVTLETPYPGWLAGTDYKEVTLLYEPGKDQFSFQSIYPFEVIMTRQS